jgi:hypothetical protein
MIDFIILFFGISGIALWLAVIFIAYSLWAEQ